MPALSVAGTAVSFLDQGHGSPVLFLHGFPLSGASFKRQIEALSQQYRVIVPDHRGFGESASCGQLTTMTQIAQDALAILDALQISKAVVLGVSMGGYASMALLREDPSRVKGLVLVDTQATADGEAAKIRREETAQAVLRLGMFFLVDTMLPKLVSPRASPAVREEISALILRNKPQGAAAALRGMAERVDARDILARYSGPTLIITGEDDEITPPEKARQIAGLVQDAKLVTLPEVGHLSNQEAPERVNAALLEFLETL